MDFWRISEIRKIISGLDDLDVDTRRSLEKVLEDMIRALGRVRARHVAESLPSSSLRLRSRSPRRSSSSPPPLRLEIIVSSSHLTTVMTISTPSTTHLTTGMPILTPSLHSVAISSQPSISTPSTTHPTTGMPILTPSLHSVAPHLNPPSPSLLPLTLPPACLY